MEFHNHCIPDVPEIDVEISPNTVSFIENLRDFTKFILNNGNRFHAILL